MKLNLNSADQKIKILSVFKGVIKVKPRNTYKYDFKAGNKIIHSGITKDLEEREIQHQQKWPKGHIVQVGRKTTKEAAEKWEETKQKS